MTYLAAANRYQDMQYRFCGRSGLRLPVLSLGLWHNFGDATPVETQRAMLRTAFDAGITHFDLANNYGPPYGSAERNFGRLFREDFRPYRNELLISTKAGWDMWPGPYGNGGSRKHLIASLDDSLRRMGLDYVDVFYSHRYDPETPLEETAAALADAVQRGKALYIGISSYPPDKTREMAALLRLHNIPCLIHQPSYSMFNRRIEDGLLHALAEEGIGCIAFKALAQGLLTQKYLAGIPADSRINRPGGDTLSRDELHPGNLARVKALNEIAAARGQSLAQMAFAWVLRDSRISSALMGASNPAQIRENVGALANLQFSADELQAIDKTVPHPGLPAGAPR